jgi:PIN domain nuclease of toxin-antitoxin system
LEDAIPEEAVLDASVLLAILHREPGLDRALQVAANAVISSVNLAEVQSKLVERGIDSRAAWASIQSLNCRSIPFDDIQARLAGDLVARTHPRGLSLGDRACLALALERKATVYTADRNWKDLNLGVDVEVIR